MSYHDLSECTLSDSERLAEADEIVAMLDADDVVIRLSDKEYDLISKQRNSVYCSVKQLFWLRDIKDRVL
jgi:ribosomal protein L16 Arg81 hydroxylase